MLALLTAFNAVSDMHSITSTLTNGKLTKCITKVLDPKTKETTVHSFSWIMSSGTVWLMVINCCVQIAVERFSLCDLPKKPQQHFRLFVWVSALTQKPPPETCDRRRPATPAARPPHRRRRRRREELQWHLGDRSRLARAPVSGGPSLVSASP